MYIYHLVTRPTHWFHPFVFRMSHQFDHNHIYTCTCWVVRYVPNMRKAIELTLNTWSRISPVSYVQTFYFQQSQKQKNKSLGASDDSNLSDSSPHGTLTSNESQKLKAARAQSKFSTFFNPFVKVCTKNSWTLEPISYRMNVFQIFYIKSWADSTLFSHQIQEIFIIYKFWTIYLC